jgi:hypothetical protein
LASADYRQDSRECNAPLLLDSLGEPSSPSAPPEPIKVAEITASAFEVAQTPPLLGRYLPGSDEQAGRALAPCGRRSSSRTAACTR